MQITAEQLLEACFPLGDAYNHREVKVRACRLVILNRMSCSEVAKLCKVAHTSVVRWVHETEQRYRLAASLKVPRLPEYADA